MITKTLSCIATVALMSFTLSANAIIVTLEGDTVIFEYDTDTPGMSAFGTLSVVGDSIFANPDSFAASSTNGGFDEYTATGAVTITAKNGYSFNSLQFAQTGIFTTSGLASVEASGNINITDSALTISDSATLTSVFTTQTWQASASFDLSTGGWENINEITLTLDSLLRATTEGPGDIASIESTFVGSGMLTIETVVPVPAAFWLFASGLMGLFGYSRYNRNKHSF